MDIKKIVTFTAAVFIFNTSHAGMFDFLSKTTSAGEKAASSDSCNERAMADYLNGMAPKPVFSADSSNYIFDQVEKQTGVGKIIKNIPTDYRDIFFGESDYSDEQIQKNAETAAAYWSSDIPESDKKYLSAHNVDFAAFADMQRDAIQIWSQMLECNQQNIHQTRLNYFLGKICEDKNQSIEIKKQVVQLSENYTQFLKSSGLINFKSSMESGLAIQNQHPLMAQIELQVLAATINSANEKKRQDMQALKLFEIDYEFYLSQKEYVSRYGSDQVSRKTDLQMEMYRKNGVESWMNFTQNALAIAVAIYSTSNSLVDKCSTYGLWPAMNRTVYSFFDSLGSWNTFINMTQKVADVSSARMRECGNEVKPFQPGYGTYSRFALTHLYETKRLFAVYASDKMSKDYSLIIDKNKPTPFQYLICK